MLSKTLNHNNRKFKTIFNGNVQNRSQSCRRRKKLTHSIVTTISIFECIKTLNTIVNNCYILALFIYLSLFFFIYLLVSTMNQYININTNYHWLSLITTNMTKYKKTRLRKLTQTFLMIKYLINRSKVNKYDYTFKCNKVLYILSITYWFYFTLISVFDWVQRSFENILDHNIFSKFLLKYLNCFF